MISPRQGGSHAATLAPEADTAVSSCPPTLEGALGSSAEALSLVPNVPLAPARAKTSAAWPASWSTSSTLVSCRSLYQPICDGVVLGLARRPPPGTLPVSSPFTSPSSKAFVSRRVGAGLVAVGTHQHDRVETVESWPLEDSSSERCSCLICPPPADQAPECRSRRCLSKRRRAAATGAGAAPAACAPGAPAGTSLAATGSRTDRDRGQAAAAVLQRVAHRPDRAVGQAAQPDQPDALAAEPAADQQRVEGVLEPLALRELLAQLGRLALGRP